MGLSLVEVLVGVVLLGIGGAATLTALSTSIRGSVTHETKIAGLSILETASSALTEQIDPCTSEAYQTRARAAIPPTGWGSSALGAPSNLTATVVCDGTFHRVTLTYTPPNGTGSSTVRLAIGGPTVAPVSGGGGGGGPTEPPAGDNTCEVVSLTANPSTMVWFTDYTLNEDVTMTAVLDGNCGEVRARLSPLRDGNFAYYPLNDAGLAQIFVIEGRQQTWAEGPADAVFEHLLGDWTAMNGGATFPAFTVDECVLMSEPTVDPATVPLHESADGRLATDLAVAASASGECDGLTWRAATGIGETLATGDITRVGTFLNGVVPGHPSGESWATGVRTVEILDRRGQVIGSAPFEVVPIEVVPT